MKKKTLSLLLLLIFASSIALAASKTVTLTTLYDYPPFCFKDKNAKNIQNEIVLPGKDSKVLKGYSWDVVRESFHAVGYTINLKAVPWSRAMHYVKTGKADLIFPATKTKERTQTFHFSDNYTDRQQFVIYVPKESSLKWKSLNSINGKRIATVNKWSFGEKYNNATKIKKVNVFKPEEGYNLLANKRVDGLVGYEVSFDYQIKQSKYANMFKKLPAFDHADEFIMGLKSNQKSAKLITAFDKGQKMITKNGTLKKITDKWITK